MSEDKFDNQDYKYGYDEGYMDGYKRALHDLHEVINELEGKNDYVL
jgi:hypothetical protein